MIKDIPAGREASMNNDELKREIAKLQEALIDPGMENIEFRYLLDLLMCSDPWPVREENEVPYDSISDSQHALEEFADRKAQYLGFTSWIDAYHNFKPDRSIFDDVDS